MVWRIRRSSPRRARGSWRGAMDADRRSVGGRPAHARGGESPRPRREAWVLLRPVPWRGLPPGPAALGLPGRRLPSGDGPATALHRVRPAPARRQRFPLVRLARRARSWRPCCGTPPLAPRWPSPRVVAPRVARFVLGHGEPVGQPHRPVRGRRSRTSPCPASSRGGGVPGPSGDRDSPGPDHRLNGGDGDELRARALVGDRPRRGGGPPTRRRSCRRLHSLRRRRSGATPKPASTWATVTPVVLPGHDDPRKLRRRLYPRSDGDGPQSAADERKAKFSASSIRRIDDLLRQAIRQAGYPDELARYAEIAWRAGRLLAGDRAGKPLQLLRPSCAVSPPARADHLRGRAGGPVPVPGPTVSRRLVASWGSVSSAPRTDLSDLHGMHLGAEACPSS